MQRGGSSHSNAPLPSWAGVPTFIRAPHRTIDELSEGMIAIAGAPTDFTAGSRPGTRYGPKAIRETSLHLAYYFQTSGEQALHDIRTGKRVTFGNLDELIADVGDFNIFPVDVPKTTDAIRSGVAAIMRQGAFPVVLGGDHYISYPAFLGCADVLQEQGVERIGYIQIDAHFDLSDDSAIWGTHYHGSNARRAAEHPMLSTENMVWIGTSGYTRTEQWDWIHDQGGHVFTIESVRQKGAVEIARKAIEHATAGTDLIYLTIDIDCLGATVAPGTGSYNIDGMTVRELLDMIDILADAPIAGFDFVEVAPTLDATGVTERIAAVAILDFLRPRLQQK